MAKRQKKKLIGRSRGIKAGLGRGQGAVGAGSKPWPGRGQGPGPGLSQARFRPRSTTLTMVSEARLRQVGGQPAALLWLQLVLLPPWSPTTTLNLRGSWGGPLTPEAQPLAWAATGGRGVSTACGKPKVMWRISGGQDVVAGQWPWQASLMYQGLHVCGAVLINSRWLVSAAHCFLKKSHAPENYRVLLGSTQLFEHTQHTLEMSVSQIVMHPDFEKLHPFGSDIAMLQLLFPVNFTSYIIPACLPAPGLQLLNNASCWITGWGMLNEETPLPTPFHLQEAKVGLIENQFCNLVYGHRLSKNFSVYEEMLCVGDFSTGKAICHVVRSFPFFPGLGGQRVRVLELEALLCPWVVFSPSEPVSYSRCRSLRPPSWDC
uniref:Peptidase S1 domain-containing protein n=1 Tax=Sus scrofa TaxID=9823 RepID=A0A4X1UPX9_PIG